MTARKPRTTSVTPATTESSDVESLGPVVNPDGTASDVTIAMLTGVTPEAKPEASTAAKPKVPRVKTCGELSEFGLGEKGCKRLPRHHGEHRVTLHRPKAVKPVKAVTAKPSAKKSAKPRRRPGVTAAREFKADLDARLTAGEITPTEALDALAKFLR